MLGVEGVYPSDFFFAINRDGFFSISNEALFSCRGLSRDSELFTYCYKGFNPKLGTFLVDYGVLSDEVI